MDDDPVEVRQDDLSVALGLSSIDTAAFVDRVRRGFVVPIVGSRLLAPPRPDRLQFAERLADRVRFPLAQTTNLPLIAQYAERRASDPGAFLDSSLEIVRDLSTDDAGDLDADHPVRLLAALPFDLYVTTSYDDLLSEAIRIYRPGGASPREVSCLWNPDERLWDPDARLHHDAVPSQDEPMVLHLLGRYSDPASMVLTEMQHMRLTDRLQSVRADGRGETDLMPASVLQALATRSWLFLGFSAADLNFRSLLRALGDVVPTRANRYRQVVAVQLLSEDAVDEREDEADDFLSWYFGRLLGREESEVEVMFGEAGDFLSRLHAELARPASREG